jgi:hypothetical protein
VETEREQAGCLPAFLRWLGIRPDGDSDSGEQVGDALPYRLRDDFLSPAERSFFGVLQLAVSGKAVLLAKVRVGDLLFVPAGEGATGFRNRINAKHVDFVLCSPETMRPLAAIELDDASHQRQDRIERDDLIDWAFAAAGLPLLRFAAQRQYDPKLIAAELEPVLSGDAVRTENGTDPAPATGSVPRCPKCETKMVLRTAGRGERKGKQFYACPNFPQCRVTRPL